MKPRCHLLVPPSIPCFSYTGNIYATTSLLYINEFYMHLFLFQEVDGLRIISKEVSRGGGLANGSSLEIDF